MFPPSLLISDYILKWQSVGHVPIKDNPILTILLFTLESYFNEIFFVCLALAMGYPLPELPNCYQNGLLLKNITSASDLIPAETPTPFRLVILSLLSAEWIRIKDTRWKSPINTISQGFFSAWDMKQVLGSPSITNLAKPLSVEDAIAFFSKARFFFAMPYICGRPVEKMKQSQSPGKWCNKNVFQLDV